MRILIVEDDFTSMLLMKKLLQPYGDCELVSDGKEAVQVFHNAIVAGTTFQLMTLDIMLPNMDGQTILKTVRLLEKEYELDQAVRCRIIMTTALSRDSDVINALKSGCDAYLVKPVQSVKLREHLLTFGFQKKES